MAKDIDPVSDFWASVHSVNKNAQHIARLGRQMDIEASNIDIRGGVDGERFQNILSRALELGLIDPHDAEELSDNSPESVKAAFDFVKSNAENIFVVASNPYAYEQAVDRKAVRMEGEKRRHFYQLTR